MKLVIDTNIIFSALYNLDSPAGKLLVMAIEEKVELVSPIQVKEEFLRALKDKLGYTDKEIKETVLALPVTWIEEEIFIDAMEEARLAISHEKDAPVIACAITLKYDVLSGDRHFHPLIKPVVKTWKLTSLEKMKLK